MFKPKHSLGDRLAALARAAEHGAPYLTPAELEGMEKVRETASARRALSSEHTVVGFFGATGSGKTALFNAIVGEDLGASSPRRPTTSSPLAAVWHPAGAAELLDWLEVEDRRNRPGDFAAKAGPLILLDLPDFDSVERSNREIAARLAGQVDVLVWVTDPEKYADSVIHDEFIRPHAAHAAVTLAVLNKADKLAAAEVSAVAASFKELLRADGLKKVTVVPTSAKTGQGLDELRAAITRVAAAHTAQTARIEADLDAVTAPWARLPAPKPVPKRAKADLDVALAQAVGADEIAGRTAASYRKRLGQTAGWLLTSWTKRLKADPLERMGLRPEADTAGVHRTNLRELDASHKAVANQGVRAYAAAAAADLPERWANAVMDRSASLAAALPDELDRAASRTRLPAVPSRAWGVLTVIQWLALVTALVGILWYIAAAFVPGVLTPLLGADVTPEIEGWPYPTLLIANGLLLGLVLGMIAAVFGGIIGSGIKSRTRRALRREIAATSQEHVAGPLTEIRESYSGFLDAMQDTAA